MNLTQKDKETVDFAKVEITISYKNKDGRVQLKNKVGKILWEK